MTQEEKRKRQSIRRKWKKIHSQFKTEMLKLYEEAGEGNLQLRTADGRSISLLMEIELK